MERYLKLNICWLVKILEQSGTLKSSNGNKGTGVFSFSADEIIFSIPIVIADHQDISQGLQQNV